METTTRFEKTKAIIGERLKDNGFTVIEEKAIQSGIQIILLGGSIISIYSTGKIVLGGTQNEDLKLLIR